MTKIIKRYCTKCGSQLIEGIAPAEKFSIRNSFMLFSPSNYAYDSITGKKQYVKTLACPRYKISWFGFPNNHEYFSIENVFTY